MYIIAGYKQDNGKISTNIRSAKSLRNILDWIKGLVENNLLDPMDPQGSNNVNSYVSTLRQRGVIRLTDKNDVVYCVMDENKIKPLQ